MGDKRLFFFGDGSAEGASKMKDILGGKGANLAEMAKIGLPVPPGFTITAELCGYYEEHGKLPDDLQPEMRKYVAKLEKVTGKEFGNPDNPLLLSVRSGAAISMPGMMDTVLNLGMTTDVMDGIAKSTDNPRFARDLYRRLIQMFGNVVSGVDGELFEHEWFDVKKQAGVEQDFDLDAAALDEIITRFKKVYEDNAGHAFPNDPWDQLMRATEAVYASWSNPRAKKYRELNAITGLLGTAVNAQTMVFGNLGPDCGTGVGFTRDPSTGDKHFYGEFLPNAQGEDVVAGIRTPLPVRAERAEAIGLGGQSLEDKFPEHYQQLMEISATLEKHYAEMQDIEFTFEHGKLYMLQTRTGKRTGRSWVVTQVDFVEEGLKSEKEAVLAVPADSLSQLLAPAIAPIAAAKAHAEGRKLAKGLNAGPGAATGKIAFTAEDAEARAKAGEKVLLVRNETTPEDIGGMAAAQGILTARGGMTSHAAVVARGMGKPCVCGCSALRIDAKAQTLVVGGKTYGPNDFISIEGSTGEVFAGAVDISPSEVGRVLLEKSLAPEESELYQKFAKLMGWADGFRKLGVHTNADSPSQSEEAIALGAEGIGLTRTEHMFFEPERLVSMRKMILAETVEERRAALAEIEPMQQGDFAGIFRAMQHRPVTIRTLDPPLHEFLPHEAADIKEVAESLGKDPNDVMKLAESLRESNPMLGHRGCRLGLRYPEITAMQARAIIGAALEVKEEGIDVHPEIMIPLVGHYKELKFQKEVVDAEAAKLFEAAGKTVDYKVGTMIEIPRAALTAGEVAQYAEFFSFGTNDLTQMTLGVSRDDAGGFLPDYVAAGIYDVDPFVMADQTGVGRLMKMCVNEGREARPDLKIGICGEHAGDPPTVGFCHDIGLDYVSASPRRVPVARLAAAHAALKDE